MVGKITELSSALMSNGEYDVYNLEKESFERAAKLFAPVEAVVVAPGGGAGDMFADDMFGDDGDGDGDGDGGGNVNGNGAEGRNGASSGGGVGVTFKESSEGTAAPLPAATADVATAAAAAAVAAAASTAQPSAPLPDFNAMGIKALKLYITSNGGDTAGALEKANAKP